MYICHLSEHLRIYKNKALPISVGCLYSAQFCPLYIISLWIIARRVKIIPSWCRAMEIIKLSCSAKRNYNITGVWDLCDEVNLWF